VAEGWFSRFEGAGLDGVIAKPSSLTYQPDKRVMLKVKHQRTVDCAVGGFRWHKSGDGIGSLLLRPVRRCRHLAPRRRRDIVQRGPAQTSSSTSWRRTAPTRSPGTRGNPGPRQTAHADKRLPGAGNRWNAKKDMSWEPLRLGLVAEVAYDGMQGNRFRHATHLERWRPDRMKIAKKLKNDANATADQVRGQLVPGGEGRLYQRSPRLGHPRPQRAPGRRPGRRKMMGGLRQATKLLGNSRYAIGDVISAAFGVPTKREFRKICLDCVQLLVERPVCVWCRRSRRPRRRGTAVA